MKLKDVCVDIWDCPHSTANDEGEGYPLIRTPNIGKGRFILTGVHRVCEDVYHIRNKRAIPQDNDLIFAREAPAGNVAIIKNGQKFCLGQRTVLIRPDQNKVNPDFLTYFLLAPEQQHSLLKTANGSTSSHVNMKTIRELQIDLPNRDYQDKASLILCEYDELIELNRRRIVILEEMAMRIYREWFVYFRFPGYEYCEFENGLPKGWNLKSIGEIISFDRGCSYTSDEIDVEEGVNLVNLKNMKPYGGYNYNGLKKYAGRYNESHIVNKGDLILGVTDMTQDRRTVGSVALIPHYSETSIISTDLVKVNSEIPNIFLYSMFRFGGYSKHLSEFANGSNVLHLKPSSIRKELILIPTMRIIDLFDVQISPLIEEMETLTCQIDRLIDMRDRLLPQLMSGQLEI
ncbi:MAG: restriction endonuclease subunit S [Muribaculaceae bacterium]|nr:restriction endonuclease subunit S [Muribaculaceae bacterium]